MIGMLLLYQEPSMLQAQTPGQSLTGTGKDEGERVIPPHLTVPSSPVNLFPFPARIPALFFSFVPYKYLF